MNRLTISTNSPVRMLNSLQNSVIPAIPRTQSSALEDLSGFRDVGKKEHPVIESSASSAVVQSLVQSGRELQ